MMEQQTTPSVSIFYSYAHEDEPLRNELEKHLSLLQRRGMITAWHDRKIVPGTDWAQTIDTHLNEATIILLLISPDFMVSDYCYGHEMQLALDRHKQGLAQVIPILLRPVDWHDAPFAHLHTLPSNTRPVTQWENRDAAFLDVVTGIRTALTGIPSLAGQHVSRPSTPVSRQNRQRLLKRVRAFWIHGMLEQSLHHAALLALGLQEQPDALANPWSLIVQETARTARPLPSGTHITHVYDDADGELLILGDPGSGKTTLLLELARDLLDRAEQDETHPMPVVFNLSSWAVKRQPLTDWLAEELNVKYQVPSQLATSWLATDRILPLLDGLDEVAPTHRLACLHEINAYRDEHDLVSLVVCSRSKEYFSQTTRIQVHNAVTVQPLTTQQIDEYLVSAGEQLTALHTLLHQDEVLLKLATNPLILSVLTLTYHGKALEDLMIYGSPDMRRRQIFAAYVQRMFEHRGVVAHYTSQQTTNWLGWLASQMALHNQTEFYLESMQPDWLWEKRPHRYYEWTVGRPMVCIMWALLHAVYSGLLAILVSILVSTIAVGIPKELLGALIGIFPGGVLISLVGGIMYGWRKGLYTAMVGIPTGALVGAVISEITSGVNRPTMGLIVGLITGMMIGVLTSIIGGEASSKIIARPVFAWSWEEVGRSLKGENTEPLAVAVIGGVSIILVGAVVTVERGVFSGLGMGGVMLLISMLLFVLDSGIRSKSLSKHVLVAPNQGIRLSARKGLCFCLAGGSSAFLVAWLVISTIAGSALGWMCGLVAGVFCGISWGWLTGWDAYVRHMVLRVLLWHAGSLPRNYTRFLDYAVERILLRKIGGGYIFVHRLLLEYFALLSMPGIEKERAQIAKRDAKDATIYYNQGLIYAEFGEYEQAIMNFTRAIERDPKEVSIYGDRGRAYTRRKEYQHALADYTHALELDPQNAVIYYQRGSVYHERKEYGKAIADFTQAITLDPKRAFFYRERASSYRFNKEYEKAIADLTTATKLAPQNAWLSLARGLVYTDLNEYEKAIADFTRAVELNSQEALFYQRRGSVYHELEEYKKAIADFTQAIGLDPERASLYGDRGWSHLFNKEHEKAIADFTRAMELVPQNAWPYRDRGIAYVELEEYEKAIADFTRAIKLEPSNAHLYSRRGSAFLHIKAYEQAIEDCTSAIELNAERHAYFHRGYAYLWVKKKELASADFVQYAALTPESVKAAWMVIYSNLDKRPPDSGIIESLEKMIARVPHSGAAHVCQGIVLGLRGDYSNGIAHLERSLQVGRSAEDASFWKGLFCAYIGQEAEAVQAITHALEAGLPPILLTPLYWLEQERPEIYQTCAVPFLVQYGI